MTDEKSLQILIIDDEKILHHTLSRYLHDSGHSVDSAYEGNTALNKIKAHDYDLILIDILLPGEDGLSLLPKISAIRPEVPAVMITGHGNMEMVINALRLGAVDFLNKPIKLLELDAVLEKTAQIRYLRKGHRHLKETIRGIQISEDLRIRNRSLIGISKKICEVRRQIQLAVESKCETILITGETGTGKEIVAREIHFLGGNEERPFIAVSCPAIPDTLIESELFGHVRGSFTGATMDKAGYFELADGGTLFLDEASDLSPSAQSKLLRVLETRKLRRLGGLKEIDVNICLIGATNVSLEDMVKTKKFREDLFYRLNIFTIKLPPLRERRSDIIPLAEHFLSTYIKGRGLHIDGFSDEAKEAIIKYDFPGNVRELRNLVERAAILCQYGKIESKHLNLKSYSMDVRYNSGQADSENERNIILNALEQARWNRRKAAKDLGMPYSTLHYKMKKLGIS
ncbi:MAG: sigma-54-dependent transcriptional regulator [bacterium]